MSEVEEAREAFWTEFNRVTAAVGQEPSPWVHKIEAIVKAARALAKSADESPPSEVPEGEAWAAGEDLDRLIDAIDALADD